MSTEENEVFIEFEEAKAEGKGTEVTTDTAEAAGDTTNTADVAEATDPNAAETETTKANASETNIPEINEPVSVSGDDQEKADSEKDGDGSEKGSGSGDVEEDCEDLEALKDELAKIVVEQPCAPVQEPSEIFEEADFPQSYIENSTKEKLVLQYAENFRRQYVHLYRDRKPLLLNPVNELSVEKFVCTTLRPTKLAEPELYNWDGCAAFVADYLDFMSLDPPSELPTKLYSPTTILERQRGNCFDYSMLLCSFLIGVGYDAYVVNGYANRETCLMDESREICPLLRKPAEIKEATAQKTVKKYAVKPAKDLRSKFELKMAQRLVDAEKDAILKKKKEAEDEQAELEKPPPDDLYGLRVHSWVLVLEGKREVAESFFIEPFTGVSYPSSHENYLGIESLWNHRNYWVNMQDCSEGCKTMKYDLGDCTTWEYMFPHVDQPILMIPDADEQDLYREADDEEEHEDDVEKQLDMPPPWVRHIHISRRDFETRCPLGKKTKLYKRARLEKFAPYLMRDGLECRLSIYEDKELIDLIETKEFYKNRADKLATRSHHQKTGWITEHYDEGRIRHLKEHKYRASAPGPENDRTMTFYHEARVDGLVKREETSAHMTEHYVQRADFLYYRTVQFGKRTKRFGPADPNNPDPRPILKITERFHRNKNVPANEDVGERVFLIAEEKIQLTYHTEDDKVSSSTREFLKPANTEDKGTSLQFSQDMHTTYQVDLTRRQKKQVELYQLMVELVEAEETSRTTVRQSEDEVTGILNERTKEEAISELEISVYDTERNEKAKKHRKELERVAAEEKKRKEEMEIDYLAPFLAQIGDPDKITRVQADRLKQDCLTDLKQRLIDKANLIQSRFEKETQELQRKQQWYQQHQVSMQKDDEDEYLNYCSEAMFRIHILELRLNRHKEMAPHKYMQLEQKLRNDPRLSEFY